MECSRPGLQKLEAGGHGAHAASACSGHSALASCPAPNLAPAPVPIPTFILTVPVPVPAPAPSLQPSLEIFEAFSELLLLKRGGETIFCGPVGEDASALISYFSAIKCVGAGVGAGVLTRGRGRASALLLHNVLRVWALWVRGS